jgi:HAD superfamily hydrolase (TIGR01509 family)
MLRPVRAVLCDLDDTLFDHAYATRCALAKLRDFEPGFQAWSLDMLDERHRGVLERLHARVLAGERTVDTARVERFLTLLEQCGANGDPDRAEAAARFYRTTYLEDWRAVPGAVPMLDALAAAGVPVVIVTNNGVAEQRLKLERVDLTRRVSALITSEEVGSCKPERAIFDTALAQAGVEAGDAVMLGDAWPTDIEGARRIGMRAIWLNRRNEPAPVADVRQFDSLEDTAAVVAALLDTRA